MGREKNSVSSLRWRRRRAVIKLAWMDECTDSHRACSGWGTTCMPDDRNSNICSVRVMGWYFIFLSTKLAHAPSSWSMMPFCCLTYSISYLHNSSSSQIYACRKLTRSKILLTCSTSTEPPWCLSGSRSTNKMADNICSFFASSKCSVVRTAPPTSNLIYFSCTPSSLGISAGKKDNKDGKWWRCDGLRCSLLAVSNRHSKYWLFRRVRKWWNIWLNWRE